MLTAQSTGGRFNWGLNILYGWYGLLVSGPSAKAGEGGKYLTGALYFDGHGGISGQNVNGGINGQTGNTSVSGSYAMSGGASSVGMIDITLQLANQTVPQTYVVALRQTTNQAVGIETDGTAIATIDLRSQLSLWNWNWTFNNASLQGTFAAVCTGNPGNYAQLNYVTFDGKGNLSGIDSYDDNNMVGVGPFSGTYNVYPDGTFLAVTAATVSFTGVLDNFNSEIEYTFNVAPLGEIIACVGQK